MESGWSTSNSGHFIPGKPGTHFTGGWVDPRAGLDERVENVASTGIRSLDRPARSQSLYRLSYCSQVMTIR